MRLLYSLLLYLISPLIPLYLNKRGKKNPNYLLNWNERFGKNLINPSSKPIIWLYSVSVGETRAMQKLVEIIRVNMPQYQILITNMTPTGRDTATKLYPQAIVHYIPYDLPHSVVNFYKTFKPVLGIIMETEIWPNLIYYGHKFNIPLYLVNARLSAKSYHGYKRFKWLIMPVLNKLNGILCQDDNTKSNFLGLGYKGNLRLVGNTKFDLVISHDIEEKIKLFKKLFGNRKIICFASTRDGEEELILDQLKFENSVLYLIIPRHLERFAVLEDLLIKRNIAYQKRSDNKDILDTTKIVIGDSLGEMLAYYAVSYLAVIGGSFKDFGGQNPIEAIYMHKPAIFGLSMFNFNDIAKNALKYGCAIQVENINKLWFIINNLLTNSTKYDKYQANCEAFIHEYQGASQRIFDIVTKEL